MEKVDVLAEFARAVELEANALLAFAGKQHEDLAEVVERLFACPGRVVVMGVGKCGHVAAKIAATLASTGTPAAFVHPGEAVHGDLGFIGKGDVALVLSNGGESGEVTDLLPHLKRLGIDIIAMTGRPQSTLARGCQYVIDTRVECEADPIGMAPTASTTLMLAAGDALACVLMRMRGFSREDYAKLHPGGLLGQKLLCAVDELMHKGDEIPACHEDLPFREALIVVTSKRLGVTLGLDDAGRLTGILTDGDIRRALQRESRPLDLPLRSVMTQKPKSVHKDMLAMDALRFMEDALITALPVVDEDNRPVGLLHIHDLIRAGIA